MYVLFYLFSLSLCIYLYLYISIYMHLPMVGNVLKALNRLFMEFAT